MAKALKKSERIEMRANPSDKKLLDMAAALSGQQMSDFLLQPALKKARTILKEHTSITLENELFDCFIDACERVEQPNEALKDALQLTRESSVE